jgi:hypothetical protein
MACVWLELYSGAAFYKSMKPQFNWLTEEDEDTWQENAPPLPFRSRRSYRRLLGLCLLLLIAGATAVALVVHRQNAAIEQVTQEVTAVFQTTQQAITRQDAELYAQLLSARDRNWFNAQRRLFAAGLPIERTPLGLQRLTDVSPMPNVTLSPTLQEAEVTYDQPYRPVAELGIPGFVTLRQTAVYRRQGVRWLQAAPDDDFWGETQTTQATMLRLTYPTRDTTTVQQIGQDLAAELAQMCQDMIGGDCPPTLDLRVEFSTTPTTLPALSDLYTPVWNGRSFLLPTPTLTGLPTNEMSYLALYRGLTRRIVYAVRTQLEAPIPLPDQQVQTLCFVPHASGLRLHTYDLRQNEWQAILPEIPFRTLTPLPDDSGLIVQELPPTLESTRLRLSYLNDETLLDLVNEAEAPGVIRPIGWSGAQPRLILQGTNPGDATPFYRWLDADGCRTGRCGLQVAAGYPVWSPDGRYTILADGSALYLGDSEGEILYTLGEGFSPTWLDADRYAFIRFVPTAEGLSAAVMTGYHGEGAPRPLFTADDLSRTLNLGEKTAVFPKFISHHPVNPDMLLIAASGINHLAGQYFIFTYHLNGQMQLRLELTGAPQGNPAQRTPTGYPPYLLSPDGRWLVLSTLRETWTFYLHNLARNETTILTTEAPALPDRFPYFDWSQNGRWLIIADQGFLRLLAPDYNYERLIPHAFDACLHTAWVN